MSHPRRPRARRAPLAASLVAALLVVAPACAGPPTSSSASPPAAASGRADDVSVVRAAAARSLEVPTARFEVEFRAGLGAEDGTGVTSIVASGSFDRRRRALEARVDLTSFAQNYPHAVAGLPAGVELDGLQVRVIGADAWVRSGSTAPWRATRAGGPDVPTQGGMSGPDELLLLLTEADGAVEEIGDGRLVGHLSVAALDRLAGAPSSADALAGQMPPGVDERFFRYEVWLADEGHIREARIGIDIDGLAEVVGETAPAGMVMEWIVRLHDVGVPVEIVEPG